MPDFFISIVSDSDHWMFLSSNGSLTAGRKDKDNALFPYYTDDKIHDYKGKTGSRTYLLIKEESKNILWEPFTDDSLRFYNTTRNLYKNIYGNKIIFEEVNNDLGLCFRYGWSNSEKYGFVKESYLINLSGKSTSIEILDGLKNILPSGLDYHFQNEYSNLADAYKKSEKSEKSSLGLFTLSAIPVDRAEPSEALFATTVWSTGLSEKASILLSEQQIGKFLRGQGIETEKGIRAARGAYFVHDLLHLRPKEEKRWFTIAEVNQSTTKVVNLDQFISQTQHPENLILADIANGTENLRRLVSMADGLQMGNNEVCTSRHFTNTLFNIMRGGIFINNYLVDKQDFTHYLLQINRRMGETFSEWLAQLPPQISYSDLLAQAESTRDLNLIRITGEYLPLTFSRRHGDPSRPWNRFSIETKNRDGSVKYYYEGNWRDIFQNWEALCYSFPEFAEGIISKFVNASTIDGYNPYRIKSDGIDWEVPEPNDPWAYIGYWGDHQIIYLQKLFELSYQFNPGKADALLTKDIFTYANVPYRIKPYEDIVQDPKDTVLFDYALHKKIKEDWAVMGSDACMMKIHSGDRIYNVNLTEKILVVLLSKLCNFIPEAGIWLNTQRPEWNDANNALVGNGTSMVTLYYMRRFLQFWEEKMRNVSFSTADISEEVVTLFDSVFIFLQENAFRLDGKFSASDRRQFADFLGKTHEKYRNDIYHSSFSGAKKQLQAQKMVDFFGLCLKYMDHSIRSNQRKDGLYHSYNLISFKDGGIEIRFLYEMLEGQVAVLSAGLLNSVESLALLDALKNSRMYREDQYSYMLYPDRELPSFMQKNQVPDTLIESSALLKKLLSDKDTSIIERDAVGKYHFNSAFRNADVLKQALFKLPKDKYSKAPDEEIAQVLEIYEQVFDHQSFTGRSGTFFAYEGLGSIYWHMVSKLMMATQECFFKAKSEEADEKVVGRLKEYYYEIKAGIGLYKNPALYGSFPTDAHSHTPARSGVKQPGLTGQVKEDVITRFGELALTVINGSIVFDTALVNEDEILSQTADFEYYNLKGEPKQLKLEKGQMGFTFCNVPIILSFSGEDTIHVIYSNGHSEILPGRVLSRDISKLIFTRNGEVEQLFVSLNQKK
ncbi:MAG: hypothetical protein JJU28_05780 [Cyclobacteriaceae bacterium]|nr:hypothetical protein [Cyclobacteriaceae bacterium]